MDLMSAGAKITFLWRLVNATHDSKIAWSPYYGEGGNSNEPFEFYATVGRFTYYVSSRDQDDYAPFDFEIWARGENPSVDPKKLETWASDDLRNPALVDPMRALYQESKKRAMGLDSVVSEMFEDLAAVDGLSADPEPPGEADSQVF